MAVESQGTTSAEPNAGAEPASATSSTSSASEGAASADPAGELKKQYDQSQTENKRLSKQIHDLTTKLKETGKNSQSVESQLQELREKFDASQRELDSRRKAERVSKSLEKAVEGVPETRRKTALAIARGLEIEGLDADDPSQAIKQVADMLKRDHGLLFEQAQTTPTVRPPVIPGTSNGAGAPKVGHFNARGVRIA